MADIRSLTSSTDARKPRRNRETEEERRKNLGALVTLISGQGEADTKFLLHKEVVCRHSKVVKSAFESAFVEDQTQIYRLRESTKEAVTYLMQYMCSQKLEIAILRDYFASTSISEELEQLICTALIEAWVLGDLLCIPQLHNFALVAFEDISNKTSNVLMKCCDVAYRLTSPGRVLRKFFVHTCIFNIAPGWFEITPNTGELAKELLVDIISYMRSKVYQNMSKKERASRSMVSDCFVPEDQ
ncbi:uncharacterized protein RSE6_02821 [Rhynchosporium secalis]|uniref:BTB domain-containing protein n=1 Tax=Rhynchosporium secalis TaxID=38038 RepID=A0A1E1M184_RHYSE|nr:uncharacterized protein RSE6_02821 [Rhynchosporium secalis]